MAFLQGAEEGVVVEPSRLLRAEGDEGVLCRAFAAALEGLPGFRETDPLEPLHRFIVDPILGLAPEGLEVRRCEQAVLTELVEREEQGIAGRGRGRVVGRMAVAGGADGQHLPPGLAAGGEEISEGEGLAAKVADAMGAGQRGRMQEKSRGAPAQSGLVHRRGLILANGDARPGPISGAPRPHPRARRPS